MSATTVGNWRERFAQDRLKGLGVVRPGRGPKPSISDEKVAEIVRATLHDKPEGETHWSCRSMARAQGVSPASVAADLVGARPEAAHGQDIQAVKRQAL